MSTIIQVKRTTTANLPSTLEQGELAYIYDTSATDTDAGGNGGRLYIGDPTTNTNTPLKIGGKYYTDMMEHVQGTLTASSALLVDSNKAIDELFIGNNSTTGGTLKLNEGTSNGTNFIGLKAPNSIASDRTITLPDATGTVVLQDTSDTLTNKTIDVDNNTVSNIEVDNLKSGVLDTDLTSVSASDDTLASAKAIKTYVDAQVTAQDLDFQGDTGGALNIDLDSETLTFAGGTGLETAGASNTLTISISNGGVDTAQLADGGVTNAKLDNSTITVAGDSGSNAVDLGDTLTIQGTANEIETSVSGDTVTVGLPDDVTVANDLTVSGNLTVNGTTTTLSTTNTAVEDTLLELNTGASSNANDSGLIIERGSTGDNAIFMWDESADKFTLGTTTATADATGDITVTVGELVANMDGNNSTFTNLPNSALTNSTFSISDDSSTTDDVALGETLSIVGGEGIDTVMTSNTLTISGELATTSNIGVASFNSANFAVTSGDVTIIEVDGGTY